MTRFVRLAAVALAGAALYASPSYAASEAVGKWNIVADAQGQQYKSSLTVAEGADGSYTADIQQDEGPMGPMKSSVSEVKVDGAMVSFKQHIATDQMNLDLTYKLTVTGDTLAGEANADFGAIPITGTRAK
ncbi:MAG: hypothetical protein P0Y56_12270 [Candidatus Andeanibacterium colombiense]|uniref:Lipocalin-like domain-containing protein n=1 Tax=Candidatus Andeanibacterium colombiense TaxID=3121345 RepID=A0AAJ5X4B6_9SPHN|nr:MAG: hypothetical protein P0Y56_12270 [Sphingomonadaceae bacterium]